jgi:hypothetical protein
MTLIIQKPTGAKLNLAQTYVGIDDPDAAVYVAAVEAADGQSLETATKVAIHSFVKGCKNDGIWPAIKASCILAGARTLSGALVPLVGPAPTNVGGLFVAGDYNRETGLVGDGSTKYLNANRASNADPQDNNHNAVYANAVGATNGPFICSADGVSANANFIAGGQSDFLFTRSRSTTGTQNDLLPTVGLIAHSRSASASYTVRNNGTNATVSVASSGTNLSAMFVFRRESTSVYSTHRIAFYSIGESLNLALLDARVTTLINAFAAAIP